ncbi:MAG: TlpA family protein disulfide reductase [Opitutales bacterium]|nr:TlpA family protein disulfide reductase [Opitutales bacterium]
MGPFPYHYAQFVFNSKINDMRDLVAHNAKFVIDYGQAFLVLGIVISVFILFISCRKKRFFVPKSFLGWVGSLFSILFICFAILGIIGLNHEKKTTGRVLEKFESMLNKEAPHLSFHTVDNDQHQTLEDYRGNVIVLNFWATWCAPCIKEMPELEKLQHDFRDKGLVVIALSDESREKLLKFSSNQKHDFTTVYNRQIEWIEISMGTARPLNLIIDRDGIIKGYFTGARDYDFFEKQIRELL